MTFNIETDLPQKMKLIKYKCKKHEFDQVKAELLYSAVLERIWVYRHKFSGSPSDFDK
jgi:hypothetical protein